MKVDLQAWAEDPDLTLKIIWNLRSIHDGKSEKEGFYRYDSDIFGAVMSYNLALVLLAGYTITIREQRLPICVF